MITTAIPDEIWADFDEAVRPEGKPDGSLTSKDIMERFGVGRSAAKDRMNKAIKNGWEPGYYTPACGGRARYILPPKGEL